MASQAEEREKRRKAYYEQDFDPNPAATSMPPPDVRVANALEYAAFHLGQINRKLDRIIEASERIAAGHPKPNR
jgi:hypothetical protein